MLPDDWLSRLRLPLIAAPMLHVSGPELVAAACASGVIGAFPTANCRGDGELANWISRIRDSLGELDTKGTVAPFAANLIVRSPRAAEHLRVLLQARVELVITSVGSPRQFVGPLHDIGCRVFADVATLVHARKAVADGADGLVLLCAGAGGQTGWVSPFAFVRAVREFFDGPIVVAGGLADGQALWAVRALGADLGYMGTRFIATPESLAPEAHKKMIVEAGFEDIVLSSVFTGLPANWLRASLVTAGLNPDELDPKVVQADTNQSPGASHKSRPWSERLSAGHSVAGVHEVLPVRELVEKLGGEYAAAQGSSLRLR